ncbi:MAG: 23S rRNA (uracil(1939)-C(5))-methyltransferase RlmD [Desulfobacteraceae bacterium]|nr:23S rRNA (uracil(1939)-C(5))-methyltransferase RlmD [Desulfobacteraceae bacterium]
MTVKKGQEIELTISDIAFGGKGLAKPDGFSIFVDKAVPLDRVNARIIKKKKNYAEARIIDILDHSAFRVPPRCEYSGFCGGCKWQFLDYNKQLEYKTKTVIDSIEHIGMINDVLVHPTIPSGPIFGYRNKMEFSCSDKRWLLPEELGNEDIKKDFGIGLHVPGTFHKIIDIKECHIQPELGNSILDDVRKFIKKSSAPVYGLKSHSGFWRFLMLRHSAAYDQWMVNIITSHEDRNILQPLSDLLMEKYPQVVSVINNVTSRKSSVAIGEYEILLAGDLFIKDKIGTFEFEISANSFFQTNTRGAEKLYNFVKKYADLSGNETIVDLYSGTGTIPVFLSDSAREIIGIEIVESAVSDARKNAIKNGVSNCRFILGDIKESLPRLSIKPDVMIIDPPRVGMHKDVIKEIEKIKPEKIVYVSCNPATMARDMGMLKEYYKIEEVQPVDMFPHTYHIESVARLIKK